MENKSNSFTIELDLKLLHGEEFIGKFKIHRPTIGERIKIGVIEAREIEGLSNVDILTSNLAHMIATFDVIVDEAPLWWKPRDLRDLEVLQTVYQKYVDCLQTFQKKPESEKTGEGTVEQS